jgi:hypothetical protein
MLDIASEMGMTFPALAGVGSLAALWLPVEVC